MIKLLTAYELKLNRLYTRELDRVLANLENEMLEDEKEEFFIETNMLDEHQKRFLINYLIYLGYEVNNDYSIEEIKVSFA